MNTVDCKNKIISQFINVPQLAETDILKLDSWKRTSKQKIGDTTIRRFVYSGQDPLPKSELVVIERANTLFVLTSCQFKDWQAIDGQTSDNFEEQLKAAADKIKHIGDYGNLYYNPKEKAVWWCAADGDGEVENGHTDFTEIERILRLPGIETVYIEAEHCPYEDDSLAPGWIYLGKRGKTVEIPWS